MFIDVSRKKCLKIGNSWNKYVCFYFVKIFIDYMLLNNYFVKIGWKNRCLNYVCEGELKKENG